LIKFVLDRNHYSDGVMVLGKGNYNIIKLYI